MTGAVIAVSPSSPCPSVRNLSFPAPNHDASCPPLQAMVAPRRYQPAGGWTRFQLSTCSFWYCTPPHRPRKYDVQGTFKATSLHESTTWTPYACDVEIISKSWSEPELVNSCVGHADTALVSSTCTFIWKQQDCLSSKVTWRPLKICLIWLYLLYLSEKLGKTRFLFITDCHQSDTIHLALYKWAKNNSKNIWSEIEMMNYLLYLIPRSESETASVSEQLHKIFAALWSEGCLSLLMR